MIDPAIRLPIFLCTLIFFSTLEFFISYRKRFIKKVDRWPSNFSLVVISSSLIKISFPTGLLYFSQFAQKYNLGLFNQFNLSMLVELFASIIIFDLLIYLQHVLSHKCNLLWRVHRVHHADIDLDATSALRFHPIEMVLSFFYKTFCIFLFGFTGESILIFEIILSSMAIFNHSNIHIHPKVEKLIRFFLVTPQMHIIHHSADQRESDTNYGFNLSIWDRIFGTYSHKFSSDATIGQLYGRKKHEHRLLTLLKMPFINYELKNYEIQNCDENYNK